MTAINTKYLGGYRTEKLARVKAMRFYLGYINHLGRLQKKSARLVRQAHQPVRQAGFSVTEVLLASSMMLIAISVSGIGVTNLLRSNYRANAGTEIQNNLNRTLEFVSDDLRRARIIAETEDAITSTKVPTGARAVLAFQIPDPNNPSQPLNEQIVYYTKNPEIGNSLTGPRVLWRYGPNLDANGNYITPADIKTWQHSPVTDRLAAAAVSPNCPKDFNRIPANPSSADGFYTCVRELGDQVILNANAQAEMTTVTAGTRDKVDYAASTRVATRAINDLFFLTVTPFNLRQGTGEARPNPTLPIVTQPATVIAEIIQGETCTLSSSCGVVAAPDRFLPGQPTVAMGSPVQANIGDGIVVFVNRLRNVYVNDQLQSGVEAYTRDNLPRNINISLNNNQVLFVLTSRTNSQSYQVLVTFTPR